MPLPASFPATYNLLEPSAGARTRRGARRGTHRGVDLANGRLAGPDSHSVLRAVAEEAGAAPDAAALAAVLSKLELVSGAWPAELVEHSLVATGADFDAGALEH